MTADGRLAHSWRAGRAPPSGDPRRLRPYGPRRACALPRRRASAAISRAPKAGSRSSTPHYWDQDAGGYFFTADDTADVILRNKTAADHATPAGNATIVEVLARLYLPHRQERLSRSRRGHRTAPSPARSAATSFPLASFLNAGELPRGGAPGRHRRRGAARQPAPCWKPCAGIRRPHRARQRRARGEPARRPSRRGKGQVDGRATAYVCSGMTCSLPILDPHGLDKALAHA